MPLAPRHAVFVTAALLLLAAPATAQTTDAPTEARHPRPGTAALAGAAAGTIGFIAGAYVAGTFHDDDPNVVLDDLEAAVIGGSVAGGLILPLGVHAGNGKQGDLTMVMGTSIVTGLAGWAAALMDDNAYFVLATPFVQLLACTIVEVKTGESAAARAPAPRRDGVGLAIAPAVGAGQAGVVVSGTF